jgi:hypothetical protein
MAKNGDRIKRIKKILSKFYSKLAKIEAEEKQIESQIQAEDDEQKITEAQKKIKEL